MQLPICELKLETKGWGEITFGKSRFKAWEHMREVEDGEVTLVSHKREQRAPVLENKMVTWEIKGMNVNESCQRILTYIYIY